MSVTESSSNYDDLEQMPVRDLLVNMNKEDKTVPIAVEKAIDSMVPLIDRIVAGMENGGRLFYIGAGTSGRLGILDASEIPPTYGMPHGKVIGLMAGGDVAIRKAVEFAEDDREQAWKDLQQFDIGKKDVVVGIAASGRTPYVIGGIRDARENGLVTGSELAEAAEFPIEVIVGPEFVTGSTRMKSGTAQKLVLNMVSTSVMIRLGRVKGNKMVDMQLSNTKLVDRGTRMIMEALQIGVDDARELLDKHGSVRAAINHFLNARN